MRYSVNWLTPISCVRTNNLENIGIVIDNIVENWE